MTLLRRAQTSNSALSGSNSGRVQRRRMPPLRKTKSLCPSGFGATVALGDEGSPIPRSRDEPRGVLDRRLRVVLGAGVARFLACAEEALHHACVDRVDLTVAVEIELA